MTAGLVLGSVVGLLGLGSMALVVVDTWISRRAEAAVPPLGSWRTVRGARLHVLDRGRGRGIVLIHGLGGQMRHLTHPLLDRLSSDFRVVALDRPGSGYSLRAAGVPAGVDTDADVVAQLIEDLGLERPLVVGHSLGGAVALATAARHPGRVGGLALLAPLTHVVQGTSDVVRSLEAYSGSLGRISARLAARGSLLRVQDAVLREIFHPEPVSAAFAVDGGGLLALRPRSFVSATADLLAVPDRLPAIEERYGAIDVPVGILYGTGDRVLHPDVQGAAMVDRVRGATVEFIDGGHMIPFTQPDRVERFVRAIAARLDSAPIGRPPSRY